MSVALDDLVSYYSELPTKGGFDSRCQMFVPGGLDSKVALDLGCRKGKGVYKLSDAVGPTGRVIGVDWREELINDARAGEAKAAEKNGLAQSNMDFIVAYPEMLDQAGIEEGSLDYVYVNSVMNLFYNPAHVFEIIGHLLKPAGLLVMQTVLAAGPRNNEVLQAARKIGNVIQAAPNRKHLAQWMHNAGMDMPTYETVEAYPISAESAVDEDVRMPVIPSDEQASFINCVVRIDKLGGFDYQQFLRDDISQFR